MVAIAKLVEHHRQITELSFHAPCSLRSVAVDFVATDANLCLNARLEDICHVLSVSDRCIDRNSEALVLRAGVQGLYYHCWPLFM